jgi:hypothetical protein
MEKLSSEEKILFDAIISARKIQTFLWGKHNKCWSLEEWRRMFRKRVKKIDDIKIDNPHWKIEMKKRLLQNSALSIALIDAIDKQDIAEFEHGRKGLKTNLSQYKKKL